MLERISIRSLGAGLMVALLALPAAAGVVVYEEGDKSVEIGGRIQLQYHATDPDDGDSEDEIFFRRLRPYIQGTVTKDWLGKFQFDIGQAEDTNEVAVKDAYMQYTGFDNLTVTVGNSKPPFSREFLTSSKRQQLVERTFVGDHNFGSPDRMLGVKLDGHNESKKVAWGVSFGAESVDPAVGRLDFDTPVNRNADFNDGWMVAGRVDFHPLGQMKFDQGDFGGDTKYTFSVAAFTWSNDDDNNTYTTGGVSNSTSRADVDTSTGFEISGGLRGHGFSIDGEYQMVQAELIDGSFTGGLFADGETDLDKFAIEGGYNFNKRFEVVAGYESFDADNYDDAWTRTSFGVNYFWAKHDIKWQLTYRMGENLDGVAGNDADELYLQWQYVF